MLQLLVCQAVGAMSAAVRAKIKAIALAAASGMLSPVRH